MKFRKMIERVLAYSLSITVALTSFPALSAYAADGPGYYEDDEVNTVAEEDIPDNILDNALNSSYTARIKGGASYKNISDAVKAAKDKDTVILIKDAKEYVVIPEGKEITLDLNGHTLKPGKNKYTIIRNKGKLTITDNSAGGSGVITGTAVCKKTEDAFNSGAVVNEKGAVLVLKNGTIKNNKGHAGAAVCNLGDFTMEGGTLTDNYATYGGGSVFNYGTFTMKGGEIKNSQSEIYGSGVYNSGTFTLSGGSISYNIPVPIKDKTVAEAWKTFAIDFSLALVGLLCGPIGEAVGALAGIVGSVSIAVSETIEHAVELTLHVMEIAGDVTATGFEIADTAKPEEERIIAYGSGIFNSGVITMTGATISYNSGNSGAGLCNIVKRDKEGKAVEDTGIFRMTGGSFIHNVSYSDAGAIYSGPDTSLELIGGEIGHNTAAGNGAGVYTDGNAEFKGTVIEKNSASSSGGGVYIGSGVTKIDGSTVSQNISAECGGGIYSAGTLDFEKGAVYDNTASVGGADIWINDESTISVILAGAMTDYAEGYELRDYYWENDGPSYTISGIPGVDFEAGATVTATGAYALAAGNSHTHVYSKSVSGGKTVYSYDFEWDDGYNISDVVFVCALCGHEERVKPDSTKIISEDAAGCENDGHINVSVNAHITDYDGSVLELNNASAELAEPAPGHKYSADDVKFIWNETDWTAFSTCEAVFTCIECGHTETIDCEIDVDPDNTAPCDEDGRAQLTAYASIMSRGGELVEAVSVKETGELGAGHIYNEDDVIFDWSEADGAMSCTATYTCLICGAEVVAACEIAVDEAEADCTSGGEATLIAVAEPDSRLGPALTWDFYETQISSLGHDFKAEERTEKTADGERINVKLTCSRCGISEKETVYVETEGVGIAADSDFKWSDAVSAESLSDYYFKAGTELDFTLTVSDINNTLSEEEKASVGKNLSGWLPQDAIVWYMAIGMGLDIYGPDGDIDNTVTFGESLRPVTLSIVVPGNLYTAPGNSYQVFSLRDGGADLIRGTETAGDELTFSVEKSGVYAIVKTEAVSDAVDNALASSITEKGGNLASGTYVLSSDVTLTEKLVIPKKNTVTIDLNGYTLYGQNIHWTDYTRPGIAGGGYEIDDMIENDGTLIIRDSSGNNSGRIANKEEQYKGILNKGTLTLESGTICGIEKGDSATSGYGVYNVGTFNMKGGVIEDNIVGVINSIGNKFTMNGGAIRNNGNEKDVGGVENEGNFEMNGGTISGNTASAGGGVYIKSYGKFTMRGGSIFANIAETQGGAVYLEGGQSSFTMEGGTISRNAASDGGAIYIRKGKVNIKAGEITDNSASSKAGGIYNNNGTLQISGGSLYANSAGDEGDDIYSAKGTKFTLIDPKKMGSGSEFSCFDWYRDSADARKQDYSGYTSNFGKQVKLKENMALRLLDTHQYTALSDTCRGAGDDWYVTFECSVCKERVSVKCTVDTQLERQASCLDPEVRRVNLTATAYNGTGTGSDFTDSQLTYGESLGGHVYEAEGDHAPEFQWFIPDSSEPCCVAYFKCAECGKQFPVICDIENVESDDPGLERFRASASVESRDGVTVTAYDESERGESAAEHETEGHIYSADDVTFEWRDPDGVITPDCIPYCSATFTCLYCGHTETVECVVTSEESKAAACTQSEERKYRATGAVTGANGTVYAEDYKTAVLEPLGHDWSTSERSSVSFNKKRTALTRTCSRCSLTEHETIYVRTYGSNLAVTSDLAMSHVIDSGSIGDYYFEDGAELDLNLTVNGDSSVSDLFIRLAQGAPGDGRSVYYFGADLNIDLYGSDGNFKESVKLDATKEPVAITLNIPNGLLTEGGDRYYVVMFDNGALKELQTVNNGDGTLTFTSDRFSGSGFAIIKEESPEPEPEEPEPEETEPEESESEETEPEGPGSEETEPEEPEPEEPEPEKIEFETAGSEESGEEPEKESKTESAAYEGHWLLTGLRFTKDDGTVPQNEYLDIDGTFWYFYSDGYAADRRREEYYSDEVIAAAGEIPAAVGTWDLAGWWYEYEDGAYLKDTWAYLLWNGSWAWYYFDKDGWMIDGWYDYDGDTYYFGKIRNGTRGGMYTGWHEIDGKWYYFDEDEGKLLKNTITPDGYKVGENGALSE